MAHAVDDPDQPLDGWFVEWVETLAAKRARNTVAAYVSDAAVMGRELLRVVGKEQPAPAGDDDAEDGGEPARLGVPAGSYRTAHAICARLTVGDLVPRHLGRAYDRVAAGRAASSVRRIGSAWSSFCNFLVRREVLASNPMDTPAVERPRAPDGDPAPLSYDEIERLFAAVARPGERVRQPWPARDLALAATLLATGVRRAEAVAARVGDLQALDVAPRLRVWGKGGRVRVVPLHDEAVLLLRDYLRERRERVGKFGADDPLFVRLDGSALSPAALRRLVESWFARAGVRRHPGATVHALRHTWATTALDSGASIVEVQTVLGHRSLETTKRYLKAVGGGVDAAMAAHPTRQILRAARRDR